MLQAHKTTFTGRYQKGTFADALVGCGQSGGQNKPTWPNGLRRKLVDI